MADETTTAATGNVTRLHLKPVSDPRDGYIAEGNGWAQGIHASILDGAHSVRLISVDGDGDGSLVDLSPRQVRGFARWLMEAAEVVDAEDASR